MNSNIFCDELIRLWNLHLLLFSLFTNKMHSVLVEKKTTAQWIEEPKMRRSKIVFSSLSSYVVQSFFLFSPFVFAYHLFSPPFLLLSMPRYPALFGWQRDGWVLPRFFIFFCKKFPFLNGLHHRCDFCQDYRDFLNFFQFFYRMFDLIWSTRLVCGLLVHSVSSSSFLPSYPLEEGRIPDWLAVGDSDWGPVFVQPEQVHISYGGEFMNPVIHIKTKLITISVHLKLEMYRRFSHDKSAPEYRKKRLNFQSYRYISLK